MIQPASSCGRSSDDCDMQVLLIQPLPDALIRLFRVRGTEECSADRLVFLPLRNLLRTAAEYLGEDCFNIHAQLWNTRGISNRAASEPEGIVETEIRRQPLVHGLIASDACKARSSFWLYSR